MENKKAKSISKAKTTQPSKAKTTTLYNYVFYR